MLESNGGGRGGGRGGGGRAEAADGEGRTGSWEGGAGRWATLARDMGLGWQSGQTVAATDMDDVSVWGSGLSKADEGERVGH